MDQKRLQQIQALFRDAADLSEAEQLNFLQAACNGDANLMADVLVMLDEDRREGSLLDGGLAPVAHQLLVESFPALDHLREFGPYRLERVLGEGGMGVVYLARRGDLGNLVAIKFLRDPWLSPARRERFGVEQRTLSQLNHPYIARLYDAGITNDGIPWFVMEYVDGIPITDYCSKHECVIRKRLEVFRCVCEAVQYAHEHAVIHRDLKPSNILVKGDGSARLLDFGIAKQLETLDRPVDQTQTEVRLMTPAYAAPEQARGEAVGVFTDVYALGLVLYELLAGARPFKVSSRTPDGAKSSFEADPEKPSTAARRMVTTGLRHLDTSRSTWADLDVISLTAIQQDPQRRYRSVEALIRDVDHHLKGEPLEARADSLSYRIGKFVGRNRLPLFMAAAVLMAVFAMAIFFTIRLAGARNAALTAAARTKRVQAFMLNLFEGGDKSAAPAESLSILTVLDRGVQEAQTLNRDPELRADLYQTLGTVYEKLGKLDRADQLLRAALEQRKAFLGSNDPDTAESLVDLGLLRVDQAQFQEAERLIRKGMEKMKRARPPDKEGLAKSTLALGKVLEARATYSSAIPVLDEAVKLESEAKVPLAELAATLKELADAQFYAGHYDICETLTRRVLDMHRQLYGERHPLVVDDLIDLGAVQFERGH